MFIWVVNVSVTPGDAASHLGGARSEASDVKRLYPQAKEMCVCTRGQAIVT